MAVGAPVVYEKGGLENSHKISLYFGGAAHEKLTELAAGHGGSKSRAVNELLMQADIVISVVNVEFLRGLAKKKRTSVSKLINVLVDDLRVKQAS